MTKIDRFLRPEGWKINDVAKDLCDCFPMGTLVLIGRNPGSRTYRMAWMDHAGDLCSVDNLALKGNLLKGSNKAYTVTLEAVDAYHIRAKVMLLRTGKIQTSLGGGWGAESNSGGSGLYASAGPDGTRSPLPV